MLSTSSCKISFIKDSDHKKNLYSSQVWQNHINTTQQRQLFCRLMLQAIDTYKEGLYHLFDAHTTTNCCHGMALQVRQAINSICSINLIEATNQIKHELEALQTSEKDGYSDWIHQFPKPVIELTSFYTLTFCKEELPNVGRRTKPKKLKEIGNVGIDFCNRLIRSLQKYYSNLVAHSYWQYVSPMKNNIQINGLPVEVWGEYVKFNYLRKDLNEMIYAPCLYSMQVTLAHLIHTKTKIAIISDVIKDGLRLQRYVQIFQGDGKTGFNILSSHDDNSNEPIIVFGGCSHASNMPIEKLMEPWLERFPSLVLACDLYYPQFPPLPHDSTFDSSSIKPKEISIQHVLDQHYPIKGVCANDPTLFCLTHIYPASLRSVLKVVAGQIDALPNFFIPQEII